MADKFWTEETSEHGIIEAESEYTRMTDEAVNELASAIIAGRVFGSWQIRPNDTIGIEQVFLFLLVMDFLDGKRMSRDGITHVWEYMDRASNTSVNGYPIFFSGYMIDKTDLERVSAKVGRAL
jgi:hypothetical protein